MSLGSNVKVPRRKVLRVSQSEGYRSGVRYHFLLECGHSEARPASRGMPATIQCWGCWRIAVCDRHGCLRNSVKTGAPCARCAKARLQLGSADGISPTTRGFSNTKGCAMKLNDRQLRLLKLIADTCPIAVCTGACGSGHYEPLGRLELPSARALERRELIYLVNGREDGWIAAHVTAEGRALLRPDTPIMRECDECCGRGSVQATCDSCGVDLTERNAEPGSDSECWRCVADDT